MSCYFTYNGYRVELEDDLVGCKFWAQHYEKQVPRFEVYEYLGKDPKAGFYFFKARKSGAILPKSYAQLNTTNFKPFLLNLNKMFDLLETID